MLEQPLTQVQHSINQALTDALQPTQAQLPAGLQRLYQAMQYVCLTGGKRVRAALVLFSYQLAPIDGHHNLAISSGVAVELIHAYSLVHDDLPAMDDDDLRRGQPSCHKQFDEATAILVGDALQALAFSQLNQQSPTALAQQCSQSLALASGPMGMVGGQMIDILATGQTITLAELDQLHQYKTGALLKASIQMGSLCADLSSQQRQQLVQFAQAIGLAFQIQDDILDVLGDDHSLGKPAGSDQTLDKATYVKQLGLTGAQKRLAELQQQAQDSLTPFGAAGDRLAALADYIVQRKH